MTPAEILAAHGILRAPEVVELAAAAHLDLACAAVLLEKESGGGRNVWGHDPVPTGGAYVPGGVVTRDNYAAYREALKRGDAGRQGVGPTQLTWRVYQDQADQEGGCWDWRANVTIGFRVLSSLVRIGSSERDGFRRYNGAGPAADAYAADASARLDRWRAWLAGAAPPEEDVPLTPDEIDTIGKRAADLLMDRPTQNAFGDVVSLAQVINGIEQRVADLQSDVNNVVAGVDLDALAGKVVEQLAARLGKAP